MAQIDIYVRNMWRLAANGVVLVSGANVTMKLATGDRFAAQNTPHATLISMIEEIAPEKVLTLLRRGQPAEFHYMHSGSSVRVRIDQVARSWRVEISPLAATAEQPRAKSAPDGGPASMTRIPTPAPPASSSPASPPASGGPAGATPGPRSLMTVANGLVPHAVPASLPATADVPVERELPAAPIHRKERPSRFDISSAASGEGRGVERLLRRLRELGGSDLHLTTGQAPAVRVDGEIRVLTDEHALSSSELLTGLLALAPESNRAEFAQRSDTDFAHDMPGVARFRVNVFRDRRGPGAVVRIIPFELRKPADLGLSSEVLEVCQLHKGLVLVTGPTGSGKSTTLATLVDHVNETRTDHIITIEDPIEFLHDSKRCLVHQREVGPHTRSFRDALRAALREDPDVILVGELRDLETMAMAVETAETGHLVFGTLHTSTAASTVERVIDQFPGDRQDQIRQMLSESLRAVIAQTLCRRIGGGRVAAYEVLFNNGAVANLIREKKTHQIPSVIQTGRGAGMVTLNDSLAELVRRKVVEPHEALQRSLARNDLRSILQRDGFRVEAAA